MELPVFLMVEAKPNPDQKEAFQTWMAQAPVVTRAHGGIPVASYSVESVLDNPVTENNEKPALFAVISFPNRSAIIALFSDPAYKALVPERDRGFDHLRYYIVHERI